jgi:hypothetical protein
VSTIAGNAIATLLATTEIDRFRSLGLVLFRRELTALVAAIAEWLPGTIATTAKPVIFPRFNINGIGSFLGDMGFILGHD